ncbi:kyphoscoliosis peptidase-like isoform X3 [Pelobates fuscus]|uniref:kyphoscoliosis peptidase-like isoform X3 n=1 Tax=Pelobates fuscus TaxID=191477 RepID=UPI002FE43E1A
MALHHDLSLWQKVLLGILCFPFLPIYLCVYCLCLKEDDKENDLEKGRQDTSHAGKAQTQQKLSSKKLSIRNKAGHTGDAQIKPKRNSLKLSFRNKGNQEAASIVPKDKDIKFPVINKGFQNDEESNNVKNGQYDNNNHLQEKKKRKDIYARTFKYPWDKSCLKSLPLDLKTFEKLDNYSSKVIGKGSIETLVKELLRDVSTDLGKTRAIWIWICHHIEYDIVGYKNEHLRSSDPKDVFKTRKGVCAGYSSLFEHMCSIAGVQCKTVSGYGKGMSYQVGQNITEDSSHAWNMVYLEGGWHLLDSTWGTGTCNNNIFSFKYNEFYFLTHPALFIEDHLPENSDCQLLEPRISQKHFEQIVYRTPYFYNLGLLFSEPDTVIIETVKGMASIVIESSSRVLYLFDLNETEKTGFVRLMECKATFFIYPEKTGKHKLNIYAKSHDSEGDYHCVLSYVVDCKSIDTSMKIPKCLRIPAGPSWLSEKAGLFQPSHPDPIIYTKNGSFTISFTVKQDLSLFCTLNSDDLQMTSEMQHRHIFQTQKEESVEFKVRLPQSGTFVLSVNIKDKNSEVYTSRCNYLVICSNPGVRWPEFPLTYSDWAKHYDLVEPLDGILPKNSNVFFKLQIPDVAGVTVDRKDSFPLTLNNQGYWEGTARTDDCKELYVTVNYKEQPKKRMYVLQYQVQ